MNEAKEEARTLKKRIAEMQGRLSQLENGLQSKPKNGRSNPINEEGQAMRPDVEPKL